MRKLIEIIFPNYSQIKLFTVVRKVLHEGLRAIRLESADIIGEVAVLLNEALKFRLKLLSRLVRPPILQISVGIILVANVIKAVRQLVSDREAQTCVV